MMRKRAAQRSGYTLMEVTISLGIAMFLLAAVYAFFYVVMNQARSGRQVSNQANLARSIFAKITDDVKVQMGPLDPRLVQLPEGFFGEAVEGEPTEETEQTTNSGTTPTTDTSGTQESTTDAEPAAEEELPAVGPALFNAGVYGASDFLVLYTSQTSRPKIINGDEPVIAVRPQLQRIVYWVAQGQNGAIGLARQVIDVATSDEALSLELLPMEAENQQQFVFAEKVLGIQFEYFDGLTWMEEWDGMLPGDAEGKLPMGPPLAIAVTVIIARDRLDIDGSPVTQSYRHVITLPTANGPAQESELIEEP